MTRGITTNGIMTGFITARTTIHGGAGRPGSFTTRITLIIRAPIQTIITVVIQVITV